MSEENISQEFRLKHIDETINYFIGEINQNKLMSKKHKKVCRVLNSIEHLLILISTVNRYSYRNCEFCSRIKYLCNNCKNQKV